MNDYLVVGTSEGDVQFLDLDRKGELTCRFPVTKVRCCCHRVRVQACGRLAGHTGSAQSKSWRAWPAVHTNKRLSGQDSAICLSHERELGSCICQVSGVHHIQIDPLRARLVTSSEQKVTIWSLMRLSTCLKEVKLSESPTIIKIALGQVRDQARLTGLPCLPAFLTAGARAGICSQQKRPGAVHQHAGWVAEQASNRR